MIARTLLVLFTVFFIAALFMANLASKSLGNGLYFFGSYALTLAYLACFYLWGKMTFKKSD